MSDKRKESRFSVRDCSVAWVPLTLLSRVILRRGEPFPLVNLSRGGIQFLSRDSLTPGARLAVSLVFPGMTSPLRLQAEVIWCRRLEGQDCFRVGIRMLRVGPRQGQALSRLARDQVWRIRDRSNFLGG